MRGIRARKAKAVLIAPNIDGGRGLDETLEDYQKVKSERRQAMDFCSGKFNAWKNVQKCIFLLLKNAHY